MSNQQGPTVEQYSSKVKEKKTATSVVKYCIAEPRESIMLFEKKRDVSFCS